MGDNIQTNSKASSHSLSIKKSNNTGILDTLVHTQVEISDSPSASAVIEILE